MECAKGPIVSRDQESRFRVRARPPKSKPAGRSERFVTLVLRASGRSGATRSPGLTPPSLARLGRGHVAARMVSDRLGANARRVIVKARYVVLKQAGARSAATHLRYIERDGVDREGHKGQAYAALTDKADVAAFEERGKGDRHQFRFIVAPEDAVAIEDLRTFTRHLMGRVEADLGTAIDWVAVDHWDTDNAHTHVVLRGQDASGQDLIIARRYIAHGMRQRACELATQWLGPRTCQEVQASLAREIDQERLTALDRALRSRAREGVVAFVSTANRDSPERHTLLVGRLQRLTSMGLAQSLGVNRWSLPPNMEQTLQAMGERNDIIRTIQRAMGNAQRELAVAPADKRSPHVVGRIAGKGLSDELSDHGYLVVDGVDGRAHYVILPAGADLSRYPVGGIVEVRGATDPRAVDKTISALSVNGLYRTDDHLRIAQAEARAGTDPRDVVAAHVRRLEALRRAGIVERVADGVWRIPGDLPEQGRQYDALHRRGALVELRSHLSIEGQVGAIGATWLDRQLVDRDAAIADTGFGADVRAAVEKRAEFLVAERLAERRDGKFVFVPNMLARLRDREVQLAAKAIGAETGLTYRRVADGARVTGVYRRYVLLASGRFAMLDDGIGFSLVPWRPVVEQRLGQTITALVRGGSVSWEFGRKLGPSIG